MSWTHAPSFVATPAGPPALDLAVMAYGDSPFLPECLASLARQTYPAARIFVTTATPSDYIRACATEFGLPVRVRQGAAQIAADWNFAYESGQANYIALCHQDDIYSAEFAHHMMTALQADPQVAMAFCANTEHTTRGPRPPHLNLRIKQLLIRRAFGRTPLRQGTEVRRRLLALGNPICCPSVVYHKQQLGAFRFSERYRSNLDWDAWDRILSQPGKIAYVAHPLVSHRVHPHSETSALIQNNIRFQEDVEMFRRFWGEPMVALLMFMYRRSYAGNATQVPGG